MHICSQADMHRYRTLVWDSHITHIDCVSRFDTLIIHAPQKDTGPRHDAAWIFV